MIAVVVAGAVVIAGIGFAGSYVAVRDLAVRKGFGAFAYLFPVGVDVGIVVLLAMDLLLTWLRIPFPLLRQAAWLLTAATIAFNGAAAWPDPLGVGMHAIIPVLFVVSVEAARHAVGRVADITADRHMESVRVARWLLAPVPTFRLWRRMKLWELRSYDEVIRLEQERLVYQARLRARYGRGWRRKAPVEVLMPLRLARLGVPLTETAYDGLAAAGITIPRPAPQAVEPDSGAAPAPEAAPATALAVPAQPDPQTVPRDDDHTGTPPRTDEPGFFVDDRAAIPAQAVALREPQPRHTMVTLPATSPDSLWPSGEPNQEKDSEEPETPPTAGPQLTMVDRYYRGWLEYKWLHGEPQGQDALRRLCQFLADRGLTGRGGTAVSPSTMRRYLPQFRTYNAWQQHFEDHGTEPSPEDLAQALTDQDFTGPAYTAPRLKTYVDDFPRRRAALAAIRADTTV